MYGIPVSTDYIKERHTPAESWGLTMTSGNTKQHLTSVRPATSPAKRSSCGFSLVDLIVSLAVITTLITILLPSLSKAQEAARRVGCASNMRQIGMALQMYAYENNDQLPESAFLDESSRQYSPQDTIFIYLSDLITGDRVQLDRSNRWDGLGVLYDQEYLEAAQAFYCPSHTGDHAFDHYAEQYEARESDIATNYQYRLPQDIRYFSDYRSSTTLLADAMRTQYDYNHLVGNYMFKADLSVTWFSDADGRFFASLPGNLASPADVVSAVESAWDRLDSVGEEEFDGSGGHNGPAAPIAGGGDSTR
jgi:type II secretory pathway pseudopilin PulG